MNRSMATAWICVSGLSLAFAGTRGVLRVSADQAALAGYSAESSRSERQWEEKFREIPSPGEPARLHATPFRAAAPRGLAV